MRKNTQVEKNCLTCLKEFKVIFCRKDTARFCSKKCLRPNDITRKKLSIAGKGRKKTEQWKKKLSEAKMSEKNPMWKGDDASLDAIHIWILARKPKPSFCEICKKQPPKDLANISQKYYRDVSDFEWICRRCHMIKDGRLENFKKKAYKL